MAAEEKDEGEKQEAAAPANGGKKKILFAIAGVVFLLVAGGIPTFILLNKKAPETEEVSPDAASEGGEHGLKQEGHDEESELEEGEEPIGAILPFDTFVVNLSGGGYVRLQVQIEFDSLDVPRKFYTKIVPMKDAIISLLVQKSRDDLENPKGREKLRTEVREIVDSAMKKATVKNVYFTQFVIQ